MPGCSFSSSSGFLHVKISVKIYFWVCCMGMGARSVVNFSRGSLCVCRSPLHYLGYTLECSLVLEHVCAGGGNVTFHGIYMFPAGILCH